MQNRVDWQFALDLVVPGAKWGWLQPAEESKTNIYGRYEYIDWRDSSIPQPSESELKRAWENYVATNGTPEEQEASETTNKKAAFSRLETKARIDADIADILELVR